jgi:hypothetical protein
MNDPVSRWSAPRRATLGGGLALLAGALGADVLGLGQPGFGERQLLLTLAGALLVSVASPARLWNAGRPAIQEAPGPAGGEGTWQAPVGRFRRAYRGLALTLLNSVVGLLLLNGLAALGLAASDRLGWTHPIEPELGSPLLQISNLRATHQAAEGLGARPEPILALGDRELAAIYPGWPRVRVAALLAESRGRSLRFDPWTQFREKPFRGRFVHVVEPGYRLGRDPGPWPMGRAAQNVWVFGGSTTFGYGLADDATIPSHLQAELRTRFPSVPIQVYNFGQGFFYSGQELALFASLLTGGVAPPHIAVFIDGINEHQREPFFSGALRDLLRSPWTAFLHVHAESSLGDGNEIVERWLRTRRAIDGVAAGYGVETLFVWQPAPDWAYDLHFHPLWWQREPRPQSEAPIFGSSPHYAAMDRLRASAPARLGSNFLWLGDLQRAERQPLYVDRLHYTGAFSRRIADAIAARLAEGK